MSRTRLFLLQVYYVYLLYSISLRNGAGCLECILRFLFIFLIFGAAFYLAQTVKPKIALIVSGPIPQSVCYRSVRWVPNYIALYIYIHTCVSLPVPLYFMDILGLLCVYTQSSLLNLGDRGCAVYDVYIFQQRYSVALRSYIEMSTSSRLNLHYLIYIVLLTYFKFI